MSARELIALGTSSLTPTRCRSHNAYLLRWDGEGFLFDPGEGTQRQLILADVAAGAVHHICISHFHGDHCLGLPGVLQRLALDGCAHPVHVYYPESGQEYLDRLCDAAIVRSRVGIVAHGVPDRPGGMVEVFRSSRIALKAMPLEHSVPTIGFRVEEPERVRFLKEKLDALGIQGPPVGKLAREGALEVDGKIVRLEDVSVRRRGSVFAFVMDTRPCAAAVALARGADLLVMEGTYAGAHAELADRYLHCTAAAAAETARDAGARRLALGHFSQRYTETDLHLREAQAIFPDVSVLRDLDRIGIP